MISIQKALDVIKVETAVQQSTIEAQRSEIEALQIRLATVHDERETLRVALEAAKIIIADKDIEIVNLKRQIEFQIVGTP